MLTGGTEHTRVDSALTSRLPSTPVPREVGGEPAGAVGAKKNEEQIRKKRHAAREKVADKR